MQSNLRYILQEETTGFAAGLVIEDNGKEGIKDGSQVSGLNNFWTQGKMDRFGWVGIMISFWISSLDILSLHCL